MGVLTDTTILGFALIFSLYALSLHITLKAGLFALANAGFGAVGAYVAANLVTRNEGFDPYVAVVVGGLAAAVIAAVVVVPFLRVRGIYLALLTFSFGQLVIAMVRNLDSWTAGATGMYVPKAMETRDLIIFVVIIGGIVARLERSRVGRTLDAIRFDEDLAAATGVPVRSYMVGVFVFSSAIAGMAGALWAQHTFFIGPDDFSFTLVVEILLYVVIGGAFVWFGPIVGAFFLTYLDNELDALGEWRQVIFGLLLVAVVLLRRNGLASLVPRSLARPRRPDDSVPGAGLVGRPSTIAPRTVGGGPS